MTRPAGTPTADPHVFIEEQRPGFVRYQRTTDGRRWEVHGVCDRRGDCLIGAVVEGEVIRDHAHLEDLKQRLGRERIDSELDVPVTPEFDSCCGADLFRYVEL
jgi:hypothetical protein